MARICLYLYVLAYFYSLPWINGIQCCLDIISIVIQSYKIYIMIEYILYDINYDIIITCMSIIESILKTFFIIDKLKSWLNHVIPSWTIKNSVTKGKKRIYPLVFLIADEGFDKLVLKEVPFTQNNNVGDGICNQIMLMTSEGWLWPIFEISNVIIDSTMNITLTN